MSGASTPGPSRPPRLTGPEGVGELLECPVCYLQFERPLQLSCGHTFCSRCIDKLVENARPRVGGAAAFHDFLFGMEERNPANPPVARNRELNPLEILENEARQPGRGRDRDDRDIPINPLAGRELDDFAPAHRALALANPEPIRVQAPEDARHERRIRANQRERDHRVQAAAVNFYPFWDDDPPPFGRRGGRGTSIRCPECRKSTVVPREGLPVNYRLQEMINRLTLNERNHEFCNSLNETLLRCSNKCEAKLDNGFYFVCNDCSDNGSSHLCPTCAIRLHNGHRIEERRALTNDDVTGTKDSINNAAARASDAIQIVEKKVESLSADFQAVIGETLNRIRAKFGHLLVGLDDMKNLNMMMLQARKEFAEKMAEMYEEMVLKMDQIMEDNKNIAKRLSDDFASMIQAELNPYALMVGLIEIKQEPIDQEEGEAERNLVGAPAFGAASGADYEREAMEVETGNLQNLDRREAQNQSPELLVLQENLRQAHINGEAARTREYRPRKCAGRYGRPPNSAPQYKLTRDASKPSTSSSRPRSNSDQVYIKTEVVVKSEVSDEPVAAVTFDTSHVGSSSAASTGVVSNAAACGSTHDAENVSLNDRTVDARSPTRKRIRTETELSENNVIATTSSASQTSSLPATPTKQSETQTDRKENGNDSPD